MGKLNIFSVFFILLLGLFCCTLASAVEEGDGLGAEPPWGAAPADLKRRYPGLLRSHAGLDRRMQKRVQRFREIRTHFGVSCEMLYDFLGRRLYQVEYNFVHPNDLTFKLVSAELVERYGAPLSSSSSALPNGELFEKRTLTDLAWKSEGTDINLRQIFSRFANGTVVRQLFVTMRSAAILRSERRPLQLQSDLEIENAGGLLRIAFAGGIDPERLNDEAAFENVRAVLKKADIAVASLDGALAAEQGKGAGAVMFAVNETAVGLLKESGLDIINLAAPGAIAAGTDAALVGADALKRAGLETLGFGRNSAEARRALHMERGGVKVAFLSFAYKGKDKRACKAAGDEQTPGFSISCAEALKYRYEVAAAVAAAKAQADVVAALFSWSDAQSDCISEEQRMLSDAAWNAGAALVVGFRRGRLQPLRGAPAKAALTSCGDLLPTNKAGAGLIFEVEINRAGLVSYDFKVLLPDENGATRTADELEARRVTDALRELEHKCNSEMQGKGRK